MILGTVDWAQGYSGSPVTRLLPLRGMMAVMLRRPRGVEFTNWVDRVRQRDIKDGFVQTADISVAEGIYYDITHYYINAVSNVTNSNLPMTGANLLAALHNLRFSGVTGPFIVRHTTIDLYPHLLY
jgi:hypothetical protein